MSHVLDYVNLSSIFKQRTDMYQHIMLLGYTLLNIHTEPDTLHIQQLFESRVFFNISLNVFSKTMAKLRDKSWFSAQNICSGVEVSYLSEALFTDTIYTLTLIAQLKKSKY